jgi:outer membrane receptor protein involved in Fe transport
VDARIDYDLPDGKQHLIFAGGYGGTSGIMHSQMGPVNVHKFFMKSYGKIDYIRGSLRITGYANFAGGRTDNLLLIAPNGQPIQKNDSNQTYHVEISDSRTIRVRHLFSYGGNFRRNEFNMFMAPDAKSRNEGGMYLQDEIILSDHFRWVIGARIDKFEFLKGAVFSPRTTFMVKPTQGQTFRVSYNRAYMAPTIFSIYAKFSFLTQFDLGLIDPFLAGNYFAFPIDFMGNTALKEPSLNAYEIGYSAIVANGRINFGAAFYINDSKSSFGNAVAGTYTSQNPPPGWPLPPFVLDLMGLPSVLTYQNLGKVRNKGIELNIDARLNRYLSGYANYSWQARPKPEGFDISLINIPPEHRFNAGMDFNYKRYLGNMSVSHVGGAYWNDIIGPAYSGPTDAYTVVNAGAGVRWGEHRTYTAMLKISNLANTPIQNHVFGDVLKRQIAGEFKMRF